MCDFFKEIVSFSKLHASYTYI